jgi:hypothetical protein
MVAGAGLHQAAMAITAGDHCRPCEPVRQATCVPRHALRSLEDSRLYLFNKTGLKAHALAGCHEGGWLA